MCALSMLENVGLGMCAHTFSRCWRHLVCNDWSHHHRDHHKYPIWNVCVQTTSFQCVNAYFTYLRKCEYGHAIYMCVQHEKVYFAYLWKCMYTCLCKIGLKLNIHVDPITMEALAKFHHPHMT